jgi:hypothetical protein
MKKKYNGRYRNIRAGDLVSGADKLLKKIGFKGLPELHLIDTSGKNILIAVRNCRSRCEKHRLQPTDAGTA